MLTGTCTDGLGTVRRSGRQTHRAEQQFFAGKIEGVPSRHVIPQCRLIHSFVAIYPLVSHMVLYNTVQV